MPCERFREAITNHAAGADIGPAAARHLEDCGACRLLLETQQRLLADVDAELTRTLAISASPELTARVASEVRISRAAPAWQLPAPAWLGLAAAATVAVGLFFGAPRTQPVGERISTAVIAGPSTPPAQPPAAVEHHAIAAASRRVPVARSTRTGAHVRTRMSPAEPPVIVDPGQARAIARLQQLVMTGRLDEKALVPVRSQEESAADLTVAPLEIAEIIVPDVEMPRPAPPSFASDSNKES